jgi:hypothetical protein
MLAFRRVVHRGPRLEVRKPDFRACFADLDLEADAVAGFRCGASRRRLATSPHANS